MIGIAVSCAISAFLGWELHRIWCKYSEVWPDVAKFWGAGSARLIHMWRAVIGREPHTWTREETLHGVESARGGGIFLGEGSVSYTWTCPCGAETEVEPYEGAGAEVSA